MAGPAHQHRERLRILLGRDSGADLNLTDRRGPIPGGSSGWTPVHVALHHEQFATAARMLAQGFDPRQARVPQR